MAGKSPQHQHPPVEEELWPIFYQILKKIDIEYQKYSRRPRSLPGSTGSNGKEPQGTPAPEELTYLDIVNGVNTRLAPPPLVVGKTLEASLVEREEMRYRQQQYRELRRVLGHLKHESQLPGRADDTDLTLVLDLDHTLIHTTELNSKTTSFVIDYMAEYRARHPNHPAFNMSSLHFADPSLSDEVVEAVPHILVYRKSKFADGGDNTAAAATAASVASTVGGIAGGSVASESKENASKEAIPPIVPPDKEILLFQANPNRPRRATEVPPSVADALPQMMREDLAGLSPEIYKHRWIMFRPGVFAFLRNILRYNEHARAYNQSLLERHPELARERTAANGPSTDIKLDVNRPALKPMIHLALYTLSSRHYADAITNMLEARLGCPPGTIFGSRITARESNHQTERTLLYALTPADIVRFVAEDHGHELDEFATILLRRAYADLSKPDTDVNHRGAPGDSQRSSNIDIPPSILADVDLHLLAGGGTAADSQLDESLVGTPADPNHPDYASSHAFFRSFAMHYMACRLIDFCRDYVAQKHSQAILLEQLHEIINDFDHADWQLGAEQVARHVQDTASNTVNLGAEHLSAERVRDLQVEKLAKRLSRKELQEMIPLLMAPSHGLPFSLRRKKNSEATGKLVVPSPNGLPTSPVLLPSDVPTKVSELIDELLNGASLVDPGCAEVSRDENGTVYVNGQAQTEQNGAALHQAFLDARAAVASVWMAGLQQFDQMAHVARGRFESALQAAFNEITNRLGTTHELLDKKYAKILTPLISADRQSGVKFAVSSLQKGLRANRLRPSRCLIIDDNRDRVWNDTDARSNLIQITQFMPFPASHDISDDEYAQLVISAVDYQTAAGYSPGFSDFVPIARCLDVMLGRLWQAATIPPGDVDAHALVYFDYELESTRQQLQQQQSIISSTGLQTLSGIQLSGPQADFTQGLRHITSPSSALLAVNPGQSLLPSALPQQQQAFNTAVASDDRANVVVAPRNIYSSKFVHHAVVTPETHRRAHAALVRNIQRIIQRTKSKQDMTGYCDERDTNGAPIPGQNDDEFDREDETYPVVILRSYAPEISAFPPSPAGAITQLASTLWNSTSNSNATSTVSWPNRDHINAEPTQSVSAPSFSQDPGVPSCQLELEPSSTPEAKLQGFQIPEPAEETGSILSPIPRVLRGSSDRNRTSDTTSLRNGANAVPRLTIQAETGNQPVPEALFSPFAVVPHFACLKARFGHSKLQRTTPNVASNSNTTTSNNSNSSQMTVPTKPPFTNVVDPSVHYRLSPSTPDMEDFPELFQSSIPPPFDPHEPDLFRNIPVSRDVRVLLYHFIQAFPNRLPITIVPSLALTSLEAIDQAHSSARAALNRDPSLAPASHAPASTYVPPYLFAPLPHRGTLVCRSAILAQSQLDTSVPEGGDSASDIPLATISRIHDNATSEQRGEAKDSVNRSECEM